MPKFRDTERKNLGLFSTRKTFVFRGEEYMVIHSGKPRPAKGECKTDVYVLASKKNGEQKEFKISVKQSNADFVENKIELSRAKEILGDDAQNIIRESVQEIKVAFERNYLICFDKYKRTDFGVADFIVIVENQDMSLQDCVDSLIPIEEYAKKQEVYFACKALNYQFFRKKCEGNRGLAVYVDWKIKEGKLCAKLVYDEPLSHKGFEIRDNLKCLLEKLNIGSDFCKLRTYLDEGVNSYIKNIECYGEN